jgi:DNA repair protein RadC
MPKLREKLINKDASDLANSELIAIIFGHGFKGNSAIQLANQLLTKYKSLRRLLNTPYYEIIKHPGFGNAKYCQLQAAAEISKRLLKEPLEHTSILENPNDAKKYIHAKLRDFRNEVFACAFLDNQHRLIEFEIIHHGTLNFTFIEPRTIVQRALHFNAYALIIAHNHPSGSAEPSQADLEVTKTVQKALQLFDILLLDHFIIGDKTTTSLAEIGSAGLK